jgi:putative membrane protein
MQRVPFALATVFALSTVAAVTIRETPPSVDDAAIVALFEAANTADIETGSLGQERGRSKEVRDFGIMLNRVHMDVRQQTRDLARKIGVTPALPPGDPRARANAEAIAKLRGLGAAEFDRAFLEHEQSYHAGVVTLLNDSLVPAIQNEELKKFVNGLVPAFEGHRQGAENLLRKLRSVP